MTRLAAIVPFALVGRIAALWLRGLNLNLSASVGFIALFGVHAHIKKRRARGMDEAHA